METAIMPKKIPTAVAVQSTPSLLRQIMDIVDEMDEGDKKLLLIKLTEDELGQKLKAFDDAMAQSEVVTEDEIDAIVSQTRQEMYEEKIRS